MKILFSRSAPVFILTILVVGAVLLFGYQKFVPDSKINNDYYTVSMGEISDTVSMSGKIEAKDIARLGFSVPGIIQTIYKEEGEVVDEGEVVASLTSNVMVAEYNTALEQVQFQRERKNELVRGPIQEKQKVARANVLLAKADLQKVEEEYGQALINARKSLLSGSLAAYPLDEDNDDVPPVISGNYSCEEEGSYMIDIFASQSQSGYSYRLSGLASGTFSANAVTPAPLGDCGLYILFDDDEKYRKETWEVAIPNKRGANYLALKNSYDAVLAEYQSALRLAKESVLLSEGEEELINASASPEEIAQMDATIDESLARMVVYEAKIADYTIRSPFDGVVSAVDMKVGEPVSNNHTVTIINEGKYDLIARIPEVDIQRVSVGDRVEVSFDAADHKIFPAKVAIISPVSMNIGGVSYYEAKITMSEEPDWLREGLNADIKIVVEEKKDVLVVPERFIINEDDTTKVLVKDKDTSRSVEVEVGVSGGGMIEVIGLSQGTEVYLP